MPTHPLWRPFERADLDELRRTRLVEAPPTPLAVVPYDPTWPASYAVVEARVRAALGDRVLELQHIGSTAVPGLAAKRVIDVDLVVAASPDEPAYVPDLEAAGFTLLRRDPAWEEHRLFLLADPRTNLHVWSPGGLEVPRHRMFRDWLRTHDDDRKAYAALKTDLAGRSFTEVMDYNNHKAPLVYDIYERIFAADPGDPHDPQPRPDATED